MKDADDTTLSRFRNHRARIGLGIASVDYDGPSSLSRKSELLRECAPLFEARRVVVMVIEPALADGNSAGSDKVAKSRYISRGVEPDSIVRMNAGCVRDEA